MLISPADVRRLMESDDSGSTLVIYQGRATVISVGDLVVVEDAAMRRRLPARAVFNGRNRIRQNRSGPPGFVRERSWAERGW
jgi:hypothetical protein